MNVKLEDMTLTITLNVATSEYSRNGVQYGEGTQGFKVLDMEGAFALIEGKRYEILYSAQVALREIK